MTVETTVTVETTATVEPTVTVETTVTVVPCHSQDYCDNRLDGHSRD